MRWQESLRLCIFRMEIRHMLPGEHSSDSRPHSPRQLMIVHPLLHSVIVVAAVRPLEVGYMRWFFSNGVPDPDSRDDSDVGGAHDALAEGIEAVVCLTPCPSVWGARERERERDTNGERGSETYSYVLCLACRLRLCSIRSCNGGLFGYCSIFSKASRQRPC